MKLILQSLLILSTIEILIFSCANPISPTGGIKDTIPPTLIHSKPFDQDLNFKEKTITLTFDEKINADKLKENLIITPIIDNKFKAITKKYSVTIQFEEAFEDSTTYTFNFFDGITDITEKNPVQNLIIAFSTGAYIDSLNLTGKITDITTGEPLEKVTVGLYTINDSLDFGINKPTYFSTTDKEGIYKLQNIKSASFRLFAFGDENRNLLFDPATENYALLESSLQMKEISGDTINLSTIQIDASKLKFISARPSGRYFEIRYSKPINHFQLTNQDSTILPSKLVDEDKTIRIYNNHSIQDSLFILVNVIDTLGNQSNDSTYVYFRESSRKLETYSVSLLPKGNTSITAESRYTVAFNKPSRLVQPDFIDVVFDTLITLNYQPNSIQYDEHDNALHFTLDISELQIKDSLQHHLDAIAIDTTNIDSTLLYRKQLISRFKPNQFKLQINPEAFVSVENDTSETISNTYKFLNTQEVSVIKVNITTDSTHYLVQLMNKKELVASQNNCTSCSFTNLKPGSYWVRIIIDSNKNGLWDIGNYQENRSPEPAIHFKEETTLRANFINELEYSF